ncbi:MAG: hypothetical protein AAF561_14365, partial [Planctomycetota bacterium]
EAGTAVELLLRRRVKLGGSAQTKAMKKVAGSLRLDLAAYRELEAFAQLGTELDPATQKQLDRGARLVELLKQPQYQPMPFEQQVMVIYAATKGYLDDVEVNRVREWQDGFLAYVDQSHSTVRSTLVETKALGDDVVEGLDKAIGEFNDKIWAKSESASDA